VTVVHDELIVEIPLDKIEALKEVQKNVLTQLNNLLKWKVEVRMGFKEGVNWYEAK
jgi:DNA polymerase I-like protein with 3'-5' exonuclease and polymerase domains